MAVDLKDNLFEIKGKLIYSKRSSAGMYLSGIAFVGHDEQMVNFVIKLVKEYNYRKSNLFIRWHSGETRPNFPITG
jgi:hypothetical protein